MARSGSAIDDGRELLHLEALQIVAADLFLVGDDVIQVVLGEVEDQFFGGHGQSRLRMTIAARSSPIGRKHRE